MCQHMTLPSASSRALLAYQCCLNSNNNAKNIMDMLKHVAPMVLQDVPCRPLAPEQLKNEATQACELLQAHYNAGRPFFSKAQLRDLAEQLARCKRNPGSPGQTIAVRGLDGRAVSFPVEIGKDHGCHPRGRGFRIIATAPALRYCPPAAAPAVFHPSLALLPVEIAFATKISSSSSSVVEPALACSSASAAMVSARLALAREQQRDCVARLCALLKPVLPEGTGKVVAFACGTMGSVGAGGCDGGEGEKGAEDEMVGRSMAQHALTLQDPGYTAVDEQVLEEGGAEVVEDPRGFLEVDETSVVVSVCPNVPVRQIVADIARPAVLIWNRVKGDEGVGIGCHVTDPVSTRVIDMLKDYDEIPWSSEEDAFKSLAVYVRRSD